MKTPLSPTDFVYKGCFKVPPHPFYPNNTYENTTYRHAYTHADMHQAPLAMRIVNGQHRFFITGHVGGNGSVTELIMPSSLSMTVSGAPVAQTADLWGTSVYGSPIRKLSAQFPNGSTQILTHGLYWDETRQILWWSFGDQFITINGSPSIGYAKLTTPTGVPTTKATATAYGSWEMQVLDKDTKGFLIEVPPSVQSVIGGRRFVASGVFTSILGQQDFGPDLIAFDEPQDTSTPITPGTYPWNTNRFRPGTVNVLRYGTGNPGEIDSHGNYQYLSRCHRPTDYSLMGITSPPPTAGAGGTTVNPYNGTGWWSHVDVISGGCYIETASKEGVVFTGGMSSGRTWYTETGYVGGVQIPNDPRGLSGWYGNPPVWNGGRIGSEFFNPGFYLFTTQDLITGATQGYGHYQQDPIAWRHTPSGTIGKVAYGGSVFDKSTNRLYVIQVGGYLYGPEGIPIIHCWEVQDTVTGSRPTTPSNLRVVPL